MLGFASEIPLSLLELLVVEHLFSYHNAEEKFVVVLGKDFLQENVMRRQLCGKGYDFLQPSPLICLHRAEWQISTHGWIRSQRVYARDLEGAIPTASFV